MFNSNRSEKISTIGIVTATALGLYFISLYRHILFHSLIEITTIAIAFTIFILTWNTRKFLGNNYLSILGIGYAFIALIDMLHSLGYKGMNVFPGFGANLPTQLWIAARFLQSVTLIIAPLFMERRMHHRVIFGIYAAVTSLFVVMVFSGIFPKCYTEGKGLTTFKIGSEYCISALLLASLYLLYRKRKYFDDTVFFITLSSVACTALSEILFTSYVKVYDIAFMSGHFFKLAAFYLIYRAILVTGFRKPFDLIFRDLKQTEEELREAHDMQEEKVRERTAELETANRMLQEEIDERKLGEQALRASEQRFRDIFDNSLDCLYLMEVTEDGRFRNLEINPAFERSTGMTSTELVGKYVDETVSEETGAVVVAKYNRCIAAGTVIEEEVKLDLPCGHHFFHSTLVPVRNEFGRIHRIVGITRNITELRQAEQERLAHVKFLESMDLVNLAIQRADDLEQMMSDVLGSVLSIFDCDRAFLQYPCDPDAATWHVPMGHSKPEYPGVCALGVEIPMDPHVAETFRILLAADGPVQFGPRTGNPLPPDELERYGFKSFMAMALHPKVDKPWQFGIHQCSSPRVWSAGEEKLLQEIGRRLADALTSMLTYRNLQENERRLALIKFALGNTHESAFLCDILGHFIYVNNWACESLGYSQNELYGMAVDDITCDYPFGDWSQQVCNLMAQGSLTFEAGHKSKDGRIIPVELNVKFFKHNDIGYILALARDITGRKRIEEALLTKQQKLTEMAVELSMAEERERRRIATELHDNISQSLLLGKIKLCSLICADPIAQNIKELEEILKLQDQMIQSVRSLTQQLSPPILSVAGLEDALEWLGERMLEDYGLRVVFVDDQIRKPLTEDMRAIVFQACRELLINVAKHAETESARVAVGREGDMLYLTVEDKGVGFDLCGSRDGGSWDRGFGLFSIKERIKYLGGEVKIESAPGQGTRVALWVALAENNE